MFDHLTACLAPDGVVFGATILGRGVASSSAARRLMQTYNAKRIFSNANDDPETLQAVLAARYHDVEVVIRGSVALFVARRSLGT